MQSSSDPGIPHIPSDLNRVDHAPYVRAVYITFGHSDLPLGAPHISTGESLRAASITLYASFDSRRLEHINAARLVWDEDLGWRFCWTAADGAESAQPYPSRLVPAPQDLLAWAKRRFDALRSLDEPTQITLDYVFDDVAVGTDAPENLERELSAYGVGAASTRELSGVFKSPIPKRSDAPKEVNVAVTEVTHVMRDHLLSDRSSRPTGGEFSILRGTWKTGNHLCVFIDASSGKEFRRIAGVGIAATSGSAGDFEKRLQVTEFTPVSEMIYVGRLKAELKQFGDALENNGRLSPARGQRLLDALAKGATGLAKRITDLKNILRAEPQSTNDRKVRPYERDATGILFEAFDIDRELLLDWHPSDDSEPFIKGLHRQDLNPHENWHIAYDQETFLDWIRERTTNVAWGLFRNRYKTRSLLVANANATSTESLLGVDFIYYNPRQGSFVMVQYKELEKAGDDLVSRVDERFRGQLERMGEVDRHCKDHTVGHPDIRLVDTPCFVKLCKPQMQMANTTDLIQGMYFTREHFETVHSSDDARGPRGGKRVGYQSPQRYLTNTDFTSLLSNGWIGSRGTGTEMLAEQLKLTLEADRSVIFGVHLDDRPRTNASAGTT